MMGTSGVEVSPNESRAGVWVVLSWRGADGVGGQNTGRGKHTVNA